MEVSCYHANRRQNEECAYGIDTLINASYYKTNHYNIETAAMKAVMDYGFSRLNLVLAFNIQRHESDGRLSSANKLWAKDFTMPGTAFNNAWMKAHLTLVEDFCGYVHRLYVDLNAERFALPGQAESGNFVQNYEIIRTVMLDDKQGYAIAHNPDAVNPYVCWQFYIRDGERDYNWGYYVNELQQANENYIARIYVSLKERSATWNKNS